jgi:hypothetical protein
VNVHPVTLAELRAKRGLLSMEAERLRASWRNQPVGKRSLGMGRRLKVLDQRVADYDLIIIAVTP